MAQSQPISIFGIHDITLYDRSNWLPAAYYRILGDVTVDMPAEFANLKGGSNLFVWDSAVSSFEPTLSIVAREYSSDIIDTNVSGVTTTFAADSSGAVTDEANVKGTSVIAATGIVGTTVVASTGAADLKEGWYTIKAVDATSVDVYAMSSANFNRGTDAVMQDDSNKITASALTITQDGTVEIPDFGLEITGGAGVIAMTANDTCRFYVQKPHGGAFSTIIGQQPMDFQEYGCVINSEVNAANLSNIILYRIKPAGMSFPMTEKGYGEFNVNSSIMYDSTLNKIGEFRNTQPE